MPQKRDEVIEEFDATQLMPDIYENWLKKQPVAKARARAGFASTTQELDREENKVELVEDAHEKAKRRKRGSAGK